MVNVEIRRLQMLNDLIAQTLDVLAQRAAIGGGISHSSFAGEAVNPWGTNGYGINPGLNPFFGTPAYGLQHTAAGYPQVNPMTGLPFVAPSFASGFAHSPFAGVETSRRIDAGMADPRLAMVDPRLGYGIGRTQLPLYGFGW